MSTPPPPIYATRDAARRLAVILLIFLLPAPGRTVFAQAFVHPGGLHDQADLDRMKAKVAAGEHPWIDGWNKLITDPLAQDTYRPAPRPNLGSRQQASRDAHAAYLNTIRWYVSGDARYAECAIRILNGWSATVNQPASGGEVYGLGGIPMAEFALAGEVLRVCPLWKPEDVARLQHMLRTYWYPVAHQFLDSENSSGNTHFWANWNLCNIGACVAIGVFCDDRAIFDEGVSYFESGLGTGSVLNAVYFVHPGGLGQWQESGRDQAHAQLGVGLAAQLCEVAWKQGVDLYGFYDNRLLAGAEYVAQSSLSKPVPYKHYTNSDNANQSWLSTNGLGRLHMPIWELVYNHYVVRRGMSAPNLQACAALKRPENGGIDHFGYGTLTFTLDGAKSPYPPAPIPPAPTEFTATPGVGKIFLAWKGSGDTTQGYEVRRAAGDEDTYETIASWSDDTHCFHTDAKVNPRVHYRYVVVAQNQSGKSEESRPASAAAVTAEDGLPAGWKQGGVGEAAPASAAFANVDGGTFVVGGSGAGMGGEADGVSYWYQTVAGNATITARLSDLNFRNSGRAPKAGLMIRESLDPNARTFFMKLGDVGGRQAAFGARAQAGGAMTWTGGNDYTWLPAWFRLTRTGDSVSAYESSDGVQWFRVGKSRVTLPEGCLVGLAVSSNSDKPSTAQFDHVTVTGTSGEPVNPQED